MRLPLTRRTLALGQGAYFAASGVWPIVDQRSFQRVTGPKADVWLVKTVGVLVTVIGAALVSAAARDDVDAESRMLGAASAAGLAAIEVVYVRRGRISRVYALDAIVEAALVAAWLLFPAHRPAAAVETDRGLM
jgi:hypothetical protein